MGVAMAVEPLAPACTADALVVSTASASSATSPSSSLRPLRVTFSRSPSRRQASSTLTSRGARTDSSCVLLDGAPAFLAAARHGSPLRRLPSMWARGAADAPSSNPLSRDEPTTTTTPTTRSIGHPPGFHRLPPPAADNAARPRVFVSVATGPSSMPLAVSRGCENPGKATTATVTARSSGNSSSSSWPLLNCVAPASSRKPVVTFGAAPSAASTREAASTASYSSTRRLRMPSSLRTVSAMAPCSPGVSFLVCVPPTCGGRRLSVLDAGDGGGVDSFDEVILAGAAAVDCCAHLHRACASADAPRACRSDAGVARGGGGCCAANPEGE